MVTLTAAIFSWLMAGSFLLREVDCTVLGGFEREEGDLQVRGNRGVQHGHDTLQGQGQNARVPCDGAHGSAGQVWGACADNQHQPDKQYGQ